MDLKRQNFNKLWYVMIFSFIISCKPSPKPTDLPMTKAGKNAKTRIDPFTGLKVMVETENDRKFKLYQGPQPPKRTTEKMSTFPVPSASSIDVRDYGPLEVVRAFPKGKVSSMSALTVAFNQPMIPLSSISEEKKIVPPIHIYPMPKGNFKWLGTSVLAFEPTMKFPFSTQYSVVVPAGIKSASGKKLAKEVRYTFQTPRVRLYRHLPYSNDYHVLPEAGIVLRFNQRISPADILKHTKLMENGKEEIGLKVVSFDKWKSIKPYGTSYKNWKKERTVVLKPVRPMKKGTRYSIKISKGVKSLEGPLTSTRKEYFSFKTFSPLNVQGVGCGWNLGPCKPGYTPRIQFNNRIRINDEDLKKFIKITPRVKEFKMNGYGDSISLRGDFKPATRYKVTVKRKIEDIYEQKLGKKWKGTLRILDSFPMIQMPASKYAVIEKKQGSKIKIRAINNMNKAKITMIKVEPEHLLEAVGIVENYYHQSYRRRFYSKKSKVGKNYWLMEHGKGPATMIQGKKISYELKLNSRKNKLQDVYFNLNKILKGKGGTVFLEIYSPDIAYNRWMSPYRYLMIQVTNIGITVRYDENKIIPMITYLNNGSSINEAELSLYKRIKVKSRLDFEAYKIWSGETGKTGMALAPGVREKGFRAPYLLVAKKGKDMAFIPITRYGHDYGYISSYDWYSKKSPTWRRLKSFLFTERNPYRPGEKVHITGILRASVTKPGKTETMALHGKDLKVSYKITGPRGQIVKKGKVPIDSDGIFSTEYKSKKDSKTGYYYFYGKIEGADNIDSFNISKSFQIRTYRAPRHSVKVKIKEGPYFYNDKLKAKIIGKYTYGAPMANAKVDWVLRRYQGYFYPPKNPGFTFYLNYYPTYKNGIYQYHNYSSVVARGKGKLNKDGVLKIEPLLTRGKKLDRLDGPGSFNLEASVYDVNRQAIANRTTTLVHLSNRYLGLKLEKTIIKQGKYGKIQFVVVDLDGKRIPNIPVTIEAYQSEYKSKKVKSGKYWSSKWITLYKKKGSCTGTSGMEPAFCKIKFKNPGSYSIRGTITDSKGRKVLSTSSIYVYGKNQTNQNRNNKKNITITTDKSNYEPGEIATILMTSPFKKSVGIFAVEQNGIVTHRKVFFKGQTHTEKIKVTKDMIPNFYVSAALIRGRVKMKAKKGDADQDPGRPMFATAKKSVYVSLESKRIHVKVTPSKKVINPGEEIEISFKAQTKAKKGVKSRLAVMIVDEGVLSLLGYATPNPVSFFHGYNSSGSALVDIRTWLLKKLKKPKYAYNRDRGLKTKSAKRASSNSLSADGYFGGSGKGGGYDKVAESTISPSVANPSGTPVSGEQAGADNGLVFKLRKLFATTVYFNANINTDAAGNAKIKVKMPDNLTGFRIMAVAMEKNVKDRYGSGDNVVKIRQQFMIRPSLPRFANYGDTFVASVVVNNQTGSKGKATVNIEGIGFKLLDNKSKQVEIEDGDSKEVGFKIKTLRPGLIRLRFAGFLGKKTDLVAPPPIEVHVPASSEATATYGVAEKSVLQPVKPPKDAMSMFGGIDLHFSSTALTGLQDAIKFLVDYRYECTEQTASRMVPIVSLKKILNEFKIASVSDKKKQNSLVEKAVNKLVSSQRWNGGFPYWPNSYNAWPHISAYTTWALLKAYRAGFKVPEKSLKSAANYLYNFSKNTYRWRWGGWYYAYTSRILSLWVLTQMSDLKFVSKYSVNKTKLLKFGHDLYGVKKSVGLFAKAWLMSVLFKLEGKSSRVKELLRIINNSGVENAGGVHFAEHKSEGLKLLMHSNSRSDSIILRSLMEVDPKNIIIPKIVRALMASRIKGAWETTQANAFALDSLNQYYKQYENVTPNFIANVWYGTGFVGSKSFKGRSMALTHKRIPMNFLLKQGNSNLILSKKGPGKLYYRLGLVYVPKNLKIAPEERGFVVLRKYEAMGDKNDVVKTGKGHWKVKAGTYVKVKLTVVVPDRRYYVAVDDPIPAGFEIVDMNLRTSAYSSLNSNSSGGYSNYWRYYWHRYPDYKDMRDDRNVLFYDRLPAGTYEYSYVTRATTIGHFVVPPLKASEMYSPEVFGRNGTEIVDVVK